jgi:serine/threonine protein kinase/tetratricopeptide (TPR) repeat protein
MPLDELHQRALSRLGTTLKAKYRLDALIGVGGMGAVYRATHRNRAELAVKMLHPELSLNGEVRGRFLREGYAANSVKHPGVVLVVDDDVAEDGSAFLVMELLDGETVEYLSESFGNKLPTSVAVAIVHQLLDVLAAAHAAGVVHRDIKPANLFVTRDGTVKVLDFGIARVLEAQDAGAMATGVGLPMGTPAFMAPEQALARSSDIDARTDVWAAGATLFTLLSGATVHETPSSAEALVNAATRAARSLATVAHQVPKPLVDVVDKALAFERDARWPSARAMGAALVDAFVAVSGAPPGRAALAGLVSPRAPTLPPRSAAGSNQPTLPQELASAPTLAAPEASPRIARPVEQTAPGASGAADTRPTGARGGLFIIALTVLAALVLAVGGLALSKRPRESLAAPSDASAPLATWTHAPDAAPRVLITAFENRTQDPVLDGTLDILIGSALLRSSALYPVAGPALRGLVAEEVPEAAGYGERIGRLLAEREHRPVALVHGFVTQDGAGFTISLTAVDGATGASFAETAAYAPSIDRVARATAELACSLRVSLHDAPCGDGAPVRTSLSDSMAANHEFAVGRASFNSGNNADAEPHFARAVELDPSFALGQASLGLLYWNTGRASLGFPHLDVALAHADQLADREKLTLEAITHLMKDEFDEAAAAYAEQLRRWPRETSPRGNLTELLLHSGRVEEAIATARLDLADHPRNVIVWGLLAELSDISGDLEEGARDAHMVVANFSKPPALTHATGMTADLLLGRKSDAQDLAGLLATVDPSSAAALEADVAAFEGRLDDARARLEKSIAEEEAKKASADAQSKLATLAEVLLRRGEIQGAGVAAGRAAVSDDLVTLVRAGCVLSRAGRTKEAASVEGRVLAHPGQRAPLFARILRAEALLARHAPKDAIVALGDIGTGAGSQLAHAILGEAELDAGATDDALRELTSVLARPGALAFAFLDGTSTLHYVPPVAYAIARAKELLHRPDAGDAYRAFLAMEPSAQGDPLVESAKGRAGAP